MIWFAGRDAFAAGNGTAPMEVSFGKRKVYGCRAARTASASATG